MNPGLPKTPDVIERFVKFLYVVEGMTYKEISEFVGIPISTISEIAKRLKFSGKRGKPRGIDGALDVLDGTLVTSLQRTNAFMQDEAQVDEVNFHRHVRSQNDMVTTRKGLVESRAHNSLKMAMEGLREFERWLAKTDALPQEACQAALTALTAYQEQQTQESLAALQGIAQHEEKPLT